VLATQASHVSKVTNELKKKSTLSCVNHTLLPLLNPDEVDVVIRLADEAEVNEIGVVSQIWISIFTMDLKSRE